MSARRTLARLVGFSAGWALVVLLERVVANVDAQLRAAELDRLRQLAELEELRRADELAARRRERCNCSRCRPARFTSVTPGDATVPRGNRRYA